jgi:hypothetical protein
MTDACGFEDLSDAEKVRFTRAENGATLAYIDELLGELDDQTGLPPDRDVSHTEDVTGRLDLDQLSATAAAGGDPARPDDDSSGPDPTDPTRRLAPQPPEEPS